MATYTTGDAVGEREDLADVIYRIDPDETPVFSNAKKEVTKGVFHEWQVQELTAASEDNFVNEGADFSYVNPTATTRLGNYHQISVKAAQVSNTLDVVDKAGRDREEAYVKVLKSIELRRDIEKSLFKNEARSASDPRKAGKLASWVTNVSVPVDGAASSGDGSDVADWTDTERSMSLALIDAAMLAAYNDGGSPDMLVLDPTNKTVFSDLNSGSLAASEQRMTAPRELTIIGSVSMYLTDFGMLHVTVDRQAGNSEAWLLDSDYYSIGHLPGRMFDVQEVAPTGDSVKFGIVSEWTLIMKAPKAHGAVYGLDGT